MIHLVFSTNASYVGKIKPFAESVSRVSNDTRNWLVGVDCKPYYTLPNITNVAITQQQNEGAPHETESVQHGSFLQVIEYEPDDIIIYCDGDMIMQRPFMAADILYLESVGGYSAGWNSSPSETLADEGARLSPVRDMVETWGEIVNTARCYNIGVLVMTGRRWQQVYEKYMSLWEQACSSFRHRARQQWLVCYVAEKLGLSHTPMPYRFHTHAHYGLPQGIYMINGVACLHDRVICFRHRF